jgi:hypothetical protein
MLQPLVEYEKTTGEREDVFFSFLLRLFVYERADDKVRVKVFFVPVYRNY